MKRILITGKTGYLATSLAKWLGAMPQAYSCNLISLKDNLWWDTHLGKHDVVVHTAAIVHRKETKEKAYCYKEINTELTYKLALKAKQDGVKHFIFISSMAVYGMEGELGRPVVITSDTACHPTTLYGKSKLEAERLLIGLQDESFAVTIVRPPMIYGPNCPGNYARLRKLVLHWGIFPKIGNERSMLFINNLCYLLERAIAQTQTGVLLPQNPEYVSTSDIVRLIGEQHGKKVLFSRVMGLAVRLIPIGAVKKLYGNLTYDKQISGEVLGKAQCDPMSGLKSEQASCQRIGHNPGQQQSERGLIGLEESIKISEMEWEKNK